MFLKPWKRGRRGNCQPEGRGRGALQAVQDGMGDFFDQIFTGITGEGGPSWWGTEVEDTETAFLLNIDAPGFEVEDFEIGLEGETLTVSAERKVESEEGTKVKRKLNRSFTLPTLVEASKVEASFRNGVLELTLPKVEHAQPRKIEVKGS